MTGAARITAVSGRTQAQRRFLFVPMRAPAARAWRLVSPRDGVAVGAFRSHATRQTRSGRGSTSDERATASAEPRRARRVREAHV